MNGLNEPMALVLRAIEQLGGRNVPLSRLLAVLPGPDGASRMYVDDLALFGYIVIHDGVVSVARAPAIVGAARVV